MQQFTRSRLPHLPAMANRGESAATTLLLASLACIIGCSSVPVAEAQPNNKWYASDVWMAPAKGIEVRSGDRGPTYGAYWGTDCNLVLKKNFQPYWSTNTGNSGTHTCWLAMQRDGNLVIYGDDNKAIWASKSNQDTDDDYYAEIQTDGNFVIYKPDGSPIWMAQWYS